MFKQTIIPVVLIGATLICLATCLFYFYGANNKVTLDAGASTVNNTPKIETVERVIDSKKEYLVIDDTLFIMDKDLEKNGFVELKLTKSDGRGQYEVNIKKTSK